MRERIKGNTLVARDEGDDANGVLIKLYGEETNGAISIIEQPFEPGFLLPPHVHQNDVWLYVLEGRCTPGLATRLSRRHPVAGC
jgi:quercetin dioxygenase-like cupin family protein